MRVTLSQQAGRVEPAALAWIAELIRESTVLASDPTAPVTERVQSVRLIGMGPFAAGSRGPLHVY